MTASPNEEATASESLESRAQAAAKAEEAVEPSFFSKLTSFLFGEREEAPTEEEAAALPVLAEAEEAIEQPPLPPRTRRLFSGAEPEMARGDFAVLGFWFVSCIIFTCGCQPIPWLTCGREKKRDPLFYTGIVLISIGGLLVVCYFNRDTCSSSHARAVDRPLPDGGPGDRAARDGQMGRRKARGTGHRRACVLQRGHLPVRPARVRARDPFLFRAASMRCGQASVRRRGRARAARRESDECARTDEAVGARG